MAICMYAHEQHMYEIIQFEYKAYFVLFIAHGRIIGRNKLLNFFFLLVCVFAFVFAAFECYSPYN